MAKAKAGFNEAAPPKAVTDPEARGEMAGPEYPKTMYRAVEVEAGADVPEGAIVVAWRGPGKQATPVYNEIRHVEDPKAAAKAADEGFADGPVLAADHLADISAAAGKRRKK